MRYHGKIGFLTESQETAPGVWNEGTIIEKDCKGDVLKSLRQYEGTSDSTNDNLIIKNRLEIVADPFVYSHIGSILYAEVNGTKWRVKDIEDAYPRLILSLGGVYNGAQA